MTQTTPPVTVESLLEAMLNAAAMRKQNPWTDHLADGDVEDFAWNVARVAVAGALRYIVRNHATPEQLLKLAHDIDVDV